MTVSTILCLPLEDFYTLSIKNQVTRDFLVVDDLFPWVSLYFLECNHHIIHIYLFIVSIQRVLPLSSSIYASPPTYLGSRSPYLWVLYQYFHFILCTIQALLFRIYGTHQANTGSSSISLPTAHCARST